MGKWRSQSGSWQGSEESQTESGAWDSQPCVVARESFVPSMLGIREFQSESVGRR